MQAACQGWDRVSWGLSARLLAAAGGSGSLPGFSRADLVSSVVWARRSLRNPPDLRTHPFSSLRSWVGCGQGSVRGRRHHEGVATTGAERPQVHVTSREEWRAWLEENHASSSGIWLVRWKKG